MRDHRRNYRIEDALTWRQWIQEHEQEPEHPLRRLGERLLWEFGLLGDGPPPPPPRGASAPDAGRRRRIDAPPPRDRERHPAPHRAGAKGDPILAAEAAARLAAIGKVAADARDD